jgi:hypothetical protein
MYVSTYVYIHIHTYMIYIHAIHMNTYTGMLCMRLYVCTYVCNTHTQFTSFNYVCVHTH